MKRIIWLIAFSLITFTALGQKDEIKIEKKDYWEVKQEKKIEFNDFKVYKIDTVDHCKKQTTSSWKNYEVNKDVCYYKKNEILSESKENNRLYLPQNNSYKYNNRYRKNFTLNVSMSAGVKLADLSISKFRIDVESETTNPNITFGGILNLYTLQYYYNGWRLEGYGRYYFVENTSGEGGFIQLVLGGGKFENPITYNKFNSLGGGVDVGVKFLVGKEKNNYRNWITITPLAGIRSYGGPDGSYPIGWVWQMRFGYQF